MSRYLIANNLKITVQQRKKQLTLNRVPVAGIIVFVLLYYYSSSLYPGGSQESLESVGFDWVNNYWCNLMSEYGMNGQINEAQPFAIVAIVILCFSVSIFFYQFTEVFIQDKYRKITIKVTGILSMIFASLIFTDYHDLMTILSVLFGLPAVFGIVKETYYSELLGYKITGVGCIILLGVNNAIYFSTEFIEWLPLIQKLTFLIVLLWILGVNNEVRKRIGVSENSL